MAQHGADVVSATSTVLSEYHSRSRFLGVDPRLILVFEVNAPLGDEAFRPAELQVLDASTRKAVVAFASDPALAAFLDRLGQYRQGIPAGRKGAAHQTFYDAIETVRRYGAADRLTQRLRAALDGATDDIQIMVDVECWYPEGRALAAEWMEEVESAVGRGGGDVIDRYLNHAAGLALIRIKGQSALIRDLAELDLISAIDLLPQPPIWAHEAFALTAGSLPDLPTPADDAPLVGIVDSGVRSAHPLLAGGVYDAVAMAGLGDGEDHHGHGTAVAGLTLHGPFEILLTNRIAPKPLCRILSVRVLDSNNEFPTSVLWPKELEEAIRYCAAEGARIINLSIGDPDTPFRGPRSTPVAALVDQIAKELHLIVVIAAGNVAPAQYSVGCADLETEYAGALLDDPACAILDPGPAALALTVGAIVAKSTPGQLGRKPLGSHGWPAPFSRHGPGINGAVKPELVAAGGTLALETGTGALIDDPELQCIVADGSGRPGALVTTDRGTSFAVPLVSRIAAAVVGQYPQFGSNLVRALVLQASADWSPEFLPERAGIGDAGMRSLCRSLMGYGEARLDQAFFSDPHRVVLVAEATIEVNGVHIYEIPLPGAFFVSGGTRGITVSLAYNPDTRSRRLDYLSSRMKFEVVRGLSPEIVERLFLESPDHMGHGDNGEDEPNSSSTGDQITLTGLTSVQRPRLEPGTASRSSGTNQLGRKVFHQKLKREDGESLLIGVQNTNRWAPSGSTQEYALAVSLWRSEEAAEIYAELQAELRQQADLRARIQVETRVRS